MTTLAAQGSHRPHAHEWPRHRTSKTLSQTDSGQFWLGSPVCGGPVYVKVGGSHVGKAGKCQEGAGPGRPAGATASLEDGESDHSLIVPLFLLLKNVPIYALKV